MAMFDEIGQLLGSGPALGQVSKLLGSNDTQSKGLLGAAIPLVLGALGKRSASEAGGNAIFDMIKGNDGSALDDIGGFLAGGDKGGIGSVLTGALLGSRKDAVESTLAADSGLSLGAVTKLLPMVAPLVMNFLGKKQSSGGLNKTSMLGMLAGEQTAMQSGGLGNVLGLLDGGDDQADEAGFMSGISKLAGLGGLGAMAAGLAGNVGDKAGAVTSGVGDRLGGAATRVTESTQSATRSVSTARPVTHDRRDDKGGGWKQFLPFLLIGLLGLALLGWLLNRDSEPDVEAVATTTTEVVTTEAEVVDETTTTAEEATTTVAPVVEGWIPGNILDTADKAGNLGSFLGAIEGAGLGDVLDGDGPFTVFAPSDEALAALPDSVKNDPALLERVLRNHVVDGTIGAGDLVDGALDSLGGSKLNVSLGSAGPTINGVTISGADLGGANGALHVIDSVLLPADVIASLGGTLNDVLGIKPINFETGSANITAEGQAILDEAAAFLIDFDTPIEIGGHTDSDGGDAANQELSQARAESVLVYLTDKGVDAANLTAVGYGEANPVADNSTDEGKAANRRIEFVAK